MECSDMLSLGRGDILHITAQNLCAKGVHSQYPMSRQDTKDDKISTYSMTVGIQWTLIIGEGRKGYISEYCRHFKAGALSVRIVVGVQRMRINNIEERHKQ